MSAPHHTHSFCRALWLNRLDCSLHLCPQPMCHRLNCRTPSTVRLRRKLFIAWCQYSQPGGYYRTKPPSLHLILKQVGG